jgi:hypothetical protein
MLVEVRTIDELRIILDGLWPGKKAGLRREDYAGLFVAGEPDENRGGPARQFARTVGCSMSNDPDAETIWFEKWLPPDAA